MGAPGIEKFKGILHTNWIKDCPVIESDINIATEIWGPDVAYLKGKSIKNKPKKFVDDIIQIPAELKICMHEVVSHMDNFWITQCKFMGFIAKPIFYYDAYMLEDSTDKSFYKVIDKFLRKLNAAGCRVTMIRCDEEFKSLMDEVKDSLGVTMDYSNPGEHESTAEQNNRV